MALLFEVPEIEATDLLPQALHDLKTARVPAPELEFIELDEGRAYARVPVDFRVRNTEPVSVTASLPAPLNVSLTVTATPATIHFTPGEPGGREITCSAAGAQAGYDASSPGECSYTYRNSSAIAPTATFTATASIDWAVSYRGSSGSGTQPGLTTSGSATIAVGEIQAVIVSA